MNTPNNAAAAYRPCGAVIFDMDGTIVHMVLDFDDIRREIGIKAGPVLETIEPWTGAARERAEAILLCRELQAAEQAELLPGVKQVLLALRACGWRLALLTRNCRPATERVLSRHGLRFDVVRTREDGLFKPSPEPVRDICRSLGVRCEDCWVVGDYLFDVQAGRAAGARTILVRGPKTSDAWADEADWMAEDLGEALAIIDGSAKERQG
jgi:HAD superfamily hydrolase (TIGR01509 family)